MTDHLSLKKALQDLAYKIEQKTGLTIEGLSNRDILILNSMAVFIGVLGGYLAVAFRWLIASLQNLILQNQVTVDYHPFTNHILGNWLYVVPPLGFLVVVTISKWMAPQSTGHGISEVIEAVSNKSSKVRLRNIIVKSISAVLTIASGGSTGREAPIIQAGAATSSALGRLFRLSPQALRLLLACGVASGMAAAFQAPIAGIIFAIEIILRDIKIKFLVPLIISSVFATVVSRLYAGGEMGFFIPAYHMVSNYEVLLFIGLGFLAAFVGTFITKTLFGVVDIFKKLPFHYTQKAIIGGLLLSLIGYFYPQVFGMGYETITQTLRSSGELNVLLALVIMKTLAMSITLACGAGGGSFVPSLFVGAVFGGAYGIIANQYFPGMVTDFGAYAIVGMAAVFAATTRATFTAIVIIFEITQEYSIILPLMLACVIADQISSLFSKETILSSVPYPKEDKTAQEQVNSEKLKSMTVEEIMTSKVLSLKEASNCSEIDMLLSNHPHSLYPVLDNKKQVSGYILKDLFLKNKATYTPKTTAKDIALDLDYWIYSSDRLTHALKVILQTKYSRIIVLDKNSYKLAGILSGKDVLTITENIDS